ncbi:MAG: thioredoxin family protein [Pirellulales bacterium]|nr:thioredoxin family protein [Pirellulales bacterium]
MNQRKFLAALLALLVLFAGCEVPQQQERGGCRRPKVLAFTASWCAPCQRAKPALVQIQAAGVDVEIIDIDAHPDLARKHGITEVPTFIVYVCEKAPVRTNDILVVVALTRFRCNSNGTSPMSQLP